MVDNNVMTADEMRPIVRNGGIDRSNVIVLDFDAPELASGDGQVQRLTDLAKALHEDENLLAIYVNVHPDDGKMSSTGRATRDKLEQDVFRSYSDYEVCIKDEASSSSWSSIEWQTNFLLTRATLPSSTPGSRPPSPNTASLTMGPDTFFLSLSFSQATDVAPYAEAMCQDVDAMELRVDLLEDRDDPFEVLYGMQKVREICRPHAVRAPMVPGFGGGDVLDDAIPIVYTVRTADQAGTYPNDPDGITRMFGLLEIGLRGAVEVLDVESAWDPIPTDSLLKLVEERYASQVLGSHHVVGEEVSTDEAVRLFRACGLQGRADAAKVVLSMLHKDDGGTTTDRQALEASDIARSQAIQEGDPVIPQLGVLLGEIGQESRVINRIFTPVTHESLPFVAAPGQLSAKVLMERRTNDGLLPTLRFGILGHNIDYSVSPAMQGGAFRVAGLPHSFERVDYESVEDIVQGDFWLDESFGGCCVTIPHKQAIIPHLDVLTDAANVIGAVNTVIVRKEKKDGDADGDNVQEKKVLVGDNTDWKGIFNPLSRLGLATSNNDSDTETKKQVALILGGGGTARAAAYAATQLGLDKIYYNRTPSKAQELAERFGGTVVSSLEQADVEPILESSEISVVISTLPAAAEFQLPEWIIENGRDNSLVVFDVNYKPYHTKLLTQAEKEGFPVVRGSEMLWEQGVGQFELWTGRTAPYRVMKDVVLNNCLPQKE